jgi:hypothetical protein
MAREWIEEVEMAREWIRRWRWPGRDAYGIEGQGVETRVQVDGQGVDEEGVDGQEAMSMV